MGSLFTIYHYLTYVFISLFSILNPIGMSTVFLSMTRAYPAEQRFKMAWRVALYGAILILVVYFLGSAILSFFGISLAALQIAGGLLIFSAAWSMMNAPVTAEEPADKASAAEIVPADDITFFPLTMPITAGAGAIAVTIAQAAGVRQDAQGELLAAHLGAVLGIVLVFVVVGVCYSLADYLFKRLGHSGTNVVAKLTAFILLSISVCIIWAGVRTLVLSLH